VSSARVAVIGLGAWGAALAQHLARNGNAVTAWARDADFIATLRTSRQHGRFLDAPALHPTIQFTSTLSDVHGCSNLILAVPSKALSAVIEKLALPRMPCATLISAIKGMEPHSQQTPLGYLGSIDSLRPHRLAVLSGPSFATDLYHGRPLSLVAAAQDQTMADDVARLFGGPTVKTYTSLDPLGVELGGITKNVIAIAAGVSDSLGYGPSARAGLITRGLSEMSRLAVALGANPKTLTGLAGLGDLIMTATENQSRNRSIGLRLGEGLSLQAALDAVGSEAEGVSAAAHVLKLAKDHGIEMPITERVVRLINNEMKPSELASELMARPTKPEH
jgi:glycerol-3-phosphate dehydrogenase (NAD(P)+)